MLLLYSDGVTEAEDEGGGQFEQERLESCLAGVGAYSRAGARANTCSTTVRTFAGERAQADDITILVVRYGGAATGAPGT